MKLIVLLTAVCFPILCYAQQEVPLNGKLTRHPGTSSPYRFTASSKGNLSFPFLIKIGGGAVSDLEVAITSPSGVNYHPTLLTKEITKLILSQCVEAKPVEIEPLTATTEPAPSEAWVMPPDFDPSQCVQFEEGNVHLAMSFLIEGWQRDVGYEETCAYLIHHGVKNEDFYPPPTYKGSSLGAHAKELYGIFHKDACGSEEDEYELSITISSSGRPSLSVRSQDWHGGMQASIKPTSEGRFAPQPLILMNWLQSRCGQLINAVKWQDGRPSKVEYVPVGDFIPYRDMRLARSPIGHLLNGGKGTFELISPLKGGYGVCFDFEKKRQVRNGYPPMPD